MRKAHILLIGPMGAGKTTIGSKLSDELALPFYDLDQLIEQSAGTDIAWIFDKEGESGFRARETKTLEITLSAPYGIISTGGGIIGSSVNRQMIQKFGTVIYLQASIETQYHRTCGDKNRPMLGDSPKLKLASLFKARQPYYQQLADLIIDTDKCSVPQTIASIQQFLAM